MLPRCPDSLLPFDSALLASASVRYIFGFVCPAIPSLRRFTLCSEPHAQPNPFPLHARPNPLPPTPGCRPSPSSPFLSSPSRHPTPGPLPHTRTRTPPLTPAPGRRPSPSSLHPAPFPPRIAGIPELQEVEATRRALEARCAVADDPKVVVAGAGVTHVAFECAMVGRTIVAARRRGKNLSIRLDAPPFPSFQFA